MPAISGVHKRAFAEKDIALIVEELQNSKSY